MRTIKIHGTVSCADSIEEVAAVVKAFDLPLNQERQSNQNTQILKLAIKRGRGARMIHQLTRGLTEAGESASHALGAVATNVTPLAGGAVSAVIGKAGTLAEALGAKLQQLSKASKVEALRRLSHTERKALRNELDASKPESLPSSQKGPFTNN
jgi:outer membrane murein-binding lipoprotein Lpp